MQHSFERMTAAGNTFVVLNTWEDPLSLSRDEMRLLVRKACDYKEGIGSDGLILINQSRSAPFRMDYYNPDGSTGMLCGNGSRCAVDAARSYGFVTTDRTEFEVLGAINRAEILPTGNVRVYFQDPSIVRLNLSLPLEDSISIYAHYVDLGSQHIVVFSEALRPFGKAEIEALNIEHFGPLLRWHPDFAPVGANANFIDVRSDGDEKYLRIRTYERGVEGETLACGTGCMSSAIVAKLTGRISKLPVRLLTQSGEYVSVNFSIEGEHIRNLSLEGSVVHGETGTFDFDEATGAFAITRTE
ncbi:MAG: diaminopimelate epimerase [Bacteroidota bacterium]|nr:diaminopimelate epimerase [Bacteroidota bacterium]MDP4233906.1 diaminopimelate epimerase [Bacteroidota bacterium]MDP4242844.1 diaminopimelate epimerase [Bacteroidota bacterium]MDP4288322.1 diaminopimelate epimerase [Bacteroidota bacterium]